MRLQSIRFLFSLKFKPSFTHLPCPQEVPCFFVFKVGLLSPLAGCGECREVWFGCLMISSYYIYHHRIADGNHSLTTRPCNFDRKLHPRSEVFKEYQQTGTRPQMTKYVSQVTFNLIK